MTQMQYAVSILKNGDVEKAWEVARTDETLNEGVTKNQWLAFAYKVIANEYERKAQYETSWQN